MGFFKKILVGMGLIGITSNSPNIAEANKPKMVEVSKSVQDSLKQLNSLLDKLEKYTKLKEISEGDKDFYNLLEQIEAVYAILQKDLAHTKNLNPRLIKKIDRPSLVEALKTYKRFYTITLEFKKIKIGKKEWKGTIIFWAESRLSHNIFDLEKDIRLIDHPEED